MKLLSILKARAIWFLPLGDLNPRGKSINRNGFPALAARYEFANVPTPIEIIEAQQKNQPLNFQSGTFKTAAGEEVALNLSAYRDALFADTQSDTEDSDAFLDDMLGWFSSEFGLIDYKTIPITKLYVSEMYISLDKSLTFVNPKLSQFEKYLGEQIKSPYKNINFEVGALGFWIDPDVKHHHVPFRLERQADVGFAEGRYFSMAPLQTGEHMKALEKLESLMRG